MLVMFVGAVLEPNPYYMLVVSLCRPVHLDLRNGKKGIATCISFLLLMVEICRSKEVIQVISELQSGLFSCCHFFFSLLFLTKPKTMYISSPPSWYQSYRRVSWLEWNYLYGRVGKFTKIKYGFSKFIEGTQPNPSL